MKKGKSKILRTVAITLAVIAALLLLAAGAVKINDLLRRNEDRSLMERFGLYHPVDGGGSDLNLISYGNADGHTIVCLSGLAVEDMCITYRDMTDELARDNRIVFIDRAGYGMSFPEAAKDLHQHENTLRYRMDKIAQITGLDFKKASDAQQLNMAYLIDYCKELKEKL